MENWKKVVRGIGLGYLLKNYSKNFIQNSKITNITKRKNSNVIYRVYYWRDSSGEFMIEINTRRKTIDHYGCYALNRGANAEELINYNLQKWSDGQ